MSNEMDRRQFLAAGAMAVAVGMQGCAQRHLIPTNKQKLTPME